MADLPVADALVIAPAGCGKTVALAARAKAVLARGEIPLPRKILALTFSNKARDNLASRMHEIVGAGWRRRITVTNFLPVRRSPPELQHSVHTCCCQRSAIRRESERRNSRMMHSFKRDLFASKFDVPNSDVTIDVAGSEKTAVG